MPATARQKSYMRDLHIYFEADITMQEASHLISDTLRVLQYGKDVAKIEKVVCSQLSPRD